MPLIETTPALVATGTVTNVSSANTAIAVATPTTTPVLTLATLDVIAADGPPVAAVAMNGQKITGLAAATAATDAASLANTLDKFAAPAANVPWNAKKITGLAAATAATDAASLANTLDQFGAPAADLSANSHKITNLTPGTAGSDAVAYSQLAGGLPLALGYKAWNYNPASASTSTAPPNQRIMAMAIWLPPGVTVTGITLEVVIAAVGTKPTSFTVGIASPTVMLRQSGDLSGNVGVPFAAIGVVQLAFSSTYTSAIADSSSGLYYVVFLQNGAYGTTQPTFPRSIGSTFGGLAGGNTPPYAVAGTGQTALPANGNAITYSSGLGELGYWVGVY